MKIAKMTVDLTHKTTLPVKVSEQVSECLWFDVPHQHIIGHFTDESFQSLALAVTTEHKTRKTKTCNRKKNKKQQSNSSEKYKSMLKNIPKTIRP